MNGHDNIFYQSDPWFDGSLGGPEYEPGWFFWYGASHRPTGPFKTRQACEDAMDRHLENAISKLKPEK